MISAAADAQGAGAVRPRVKRAQETFPTLIDSEKQLGALFSYRLVPNGIFIGEDGTVLQVHIGGFDVRDAATRERAEAFSAGQVVGWPTAGPSAGRGTCLETELVQARILLAAALLRLGRRGSAVTELERALTLDPENFDVRKQIWAVRYPERFYWE